MKVKVNQGNAVDHGGKRYEAGDTADLPEAYAEKLIAAGAVSPDTTQTKPAAAAKKEG